MLLRPHLVSSPQPLTVFQLVGFVYACSVVSVFTEEEDSCKCVAGRCPKSPSPALQALGEGEESSRSASERAFLSSAL